MADKVIQMVRVQCLDIVYVHGEKTLVPRFRLEREKEPENYDVNYDSCGQRYMVRREW